jgi:hypothetical protein
MAATGSRRDPVPRSGTGEPGWRDGLHPSCGVKPRPSGREGHTAPSLRRVTRYPHCGQLALLSPILHLGVGRVRSRGHGPIVEAVVQPSRPALVKPDIYSRRQAAHCTVPVGRTYPASNAVGGVCADDLGSAESSGSGVRTTLSLANTFENLLSISNNGKLCHGTEAAEGSGRADGIRPGPNAASLRPAVATKRQAAPWTSPAGNTGHG